MKIHIVKKGDTLYFIGQKYNVSIEQILSLNPSITNPDVLDVGMKLKIPGAQGQNGISGMEIMHQHVVKQGDTLWKLSKAWGVPLATMVYANPHLKNPNVLLTGEIVNIPKADTVVPPSSAPGKTNTGVKPSGGGAHPLHPTSIMQGVQGIVGKLSTAPVIGKKNTAPVQEKAPTAPVSPVPAPAPAPKEKQAKVEPLDTGKVEPLAKKVEPLDTGKVEPLSTKTAPLDTGKVEPLDTGKVEPLATKVEPLSTGKTLPNQSVAPLSTGKSLPNAQVAPLSTGKTLPNAQVAPLSTGKTLPNSSVAPLGTNNMAPMSTNVAPLGTNNMAPMSTNVAPLGTNNMAPMSTNVSPLGTNNMAPMSTNVSPLGTNNMAPMSTNVAPLGTNNMAPMSTNNAGPNATMAPNAVSPTPYASKKALPIEKAPETKVYPAQSEYMQYMDMNLFQQYNVPATEALYTGNQSNFAPLSANVNMAPYGTMAPMFPYDCPPGTVMGYPTPSVTPYGGGGWGYPGGGYAGINEHGMVSPLSNMPNNAGLVSPLSGMPTKGLPNTMSTQSLPGYNEAGYPMTYPPYAPSPLWPQNAAVSPAPTAQTPSDDCGCGGKREEEAELQQKSKSTSGKFAAPKPRKKAKKAVIRTVAPRPKKKTTSGSRPWLNR